jgi:hypothetical protein
MMRSTAIQGQRDSGPQASIARTFASIFCQ